MLGECLGEHHYIGRCRQEYCPPSGKSVAHCQRHRSATQRVSHHSVHRPRGICHGPERACELRERRQPAHRLSMGRRIEESHSKAGFGQS
jgi:hypothetical protein